MLAALKAHGFADNTLVIFSADNGAEVYAYARIQSFAHRSSGPLRGVKRDLWEGGHRVPFIVRCVAPSRATVSELRRSGGKSQPRSESGILRQERRPVRPVVQLRSPGEDFFAKGYRVGLSIRNVGTRQVLILEGPRPATFRLSRVREA